MYTTAQTLAIAAATAQRWDELNSIAYDLTEEMAVDAAALLLERGEQVAAIMLTLANVFADQEVTL